MTEQPARSGTLYNSPPLSHRQVTGHLTDGVWRSERVRVAANASERPADVAPGATNKVLKFTGTIGAKG